MANTRTLNSQTFSNLLSLSETIAFGADPTIASLPASPAMGSGLWRYDGTVGPAVTKAWHRKITLSAGVATIDLTALADDILTTVDMSGLKLRHLQLTADSANTQPVTVAPGAVNAYTGWCKAAGGLSLGAADQQALGPLYSGIAVDGTHKNIDFASAMAAAVITVTALFG